MYIKTGKKKIYFSYNGEKLTLDHNIYSNEWVICIHVNVLTLETKHKYYPPTHTTLPLPTPTHHDVDFMIHPTMMWIS